MAEAEQQEIEEELEEIYLCVEKIILLFDIIYHSYTCNEGYPMKKLPFGMKYSAGYALGVFNTSGQFFIEYSSLLVYNR